MELNKQEFAQFEKNENLFERVYSGVSYWQMLRFMVCEGADSNRIENEDAIRDNQRKKNFLKLIVSAFKYALLNVGESNKLKPCDIVCFTHDDQKDQAVRFFDYWNMPSDISMMEINEAYDPLALRTKEKGTLMVPYVKTQLRYFCKKALGKIKKDNDESFFLQELEQKVRESFGRSISAARMEQAIQKWIEIDREYEKYFSKLFDRLQCRAIVVVCYYQVQLYAAYREAKKRNIRIIELQHGVINNHEEYWFEDRRGLNNYTPDYFLAFGNSHVLWTNMLDTTRPVVTGFPYQEYQINKLANLETQENIVIVYPQAECEFEQVINEFAEIVIKKGYRIIIKLHPLQALDYEMYYPLLSKNSSLEVITSQSEGIYYWLKLAKHHVMANTTVGLEAVAFPHTNICIAENVSHEQTQPLLDWKVARGFFNAQGLMELIENPNTAVSEKAKENLWKKDSAKNVATFFKKLKEQNWVESRNFVE